MNFIRILAVSLFFNLLISNGYAQIFKVEKKLNIRDALRTYRRINDLGIAGDASEGNIEVRMYAKYNYTTGGRSDTNSFLYGIYADQKSSGSQRQLKSWDVAENTFLCSLSGYYCNTTKSTRFKNRILPYSKIISILSVDANEAGDFFTWFRGTPEMDVVIELELEGVTKLADIQSIKLPGVEKLYPEDFASIVFEGDFSHLFNPSHDITVVAHRGFWRDYGVAENTPNAIDASNNLPNLDWMELDVRSNGSKVPILFHDDLPQRRLQDIWRDPGTTFPAPQHTLTNYDVTFDQLKDYYVYDRFDHRTDQKLATVEAAFAHIKQKVDQGILQLPINLDNGVGATIRKYDPATGGIKKEPVGEDPHHEPLFLNTVSLACKYGITKYVVFKARFPYDDPIWQKVADTLCKYARHEGMVLKVPAIAYMPRFGEESTRMNGMDVLDEEFSEWMEIYKHQKNGTPTNLQFNEAIKVVAMEIRVKQISQDPSDINYRLLDKVMQARNEGLPTGLSSPNATGCIGDNNADATVRVKTQKSFDDDRRADFEWLVKNGFDFVITDYPDNLIALRNRIEGAAYGERTNFTNPSQHLHNRNQIITKGFGVRIISTLGDLKNKVIAELGKHERMFWRLSTDEEGIFHITRFIKDGTTEYSWKLKMYEPTRARYTALGDSEEVYFMLVQEPDQVRLQVGMPDGTFDCMFAPYGVNSTVLGQDWNAAPLNIGVFVESTVNTDIGNIHFLNKAYCRTDAFDDAYNRYFRTKLPDMSREALSQKYGPLNHLSEYRAISDKAEDQAMYDDDVTRLGGCDNDLSITAPLQTFAVIGDYGCDRGFNNKDPNNIIYSGTSKIAKLVKDWSPDFIVSLGDDNYRYQSSGHCANTFEDNVGQYYGTFIGNTEISNAFYPIPGNHDYECADNSVSLACLDDWLDYFPTELYNPDPSNNGRYYDFKRGNIHFFAISTMFDTNNDVILEPDGIEYDPLDPDNVANDPRYKQAKWLKDGLQASEDAGELFQVVYMHQPPISSISPDDRDVVAQQKLRWPYEEWGADLVLAGDDHFFEHWEYNGLDYMVAGTGGHPTLKIPSEEGNTAAPTGAIKENGIYNKFGALRIEEWPGFLRVEYEFLNESNNGIKGLVQNGIGYDLATEQGSADGLKVSYIKDVFPKSRQNPVARLTSKADVKAPFQDLNVLRASEFQVYPNPSKGVFNVRFGRVFDEDEIVQLMVRDLNGREIARQTVKLVAGSNLVKWDIKSSTYNSMPNGVYTLIVKSSQGLESNTIIYDCGCE